ncbi:hypothetical protein LTR37_005709 [Vermiconidia calcicola]|uniref:Uncharacterized protein n=1 Tax=Vermiconidia calcicola TaxID=1690605 RepID=A0ACC3NIG7_9PEZI|nr:hypothetical protein LTR37_005709 [Vermiconidia calcicola]
MPGDHASVAQAQRQEHYESPEDFVSSTSSAEEYNCQDNKDIYEVQPIRDTPTERPQAPERHDSLIDMPLIETLSIDTVDKAGHSGRQCISHAHPSKSPITLVPALKLDTSYGTLESGSQRRRRERRNIGTQASQQEAVVGQSEVTINVVETPRGRRSHRRVSPDRNRRGEIAIIESENEDDEEDDGDVRGRQRTRPSELRCFGGGGVSVAKSKQLNGPKRAYPGVTPVSPSLPKKFHYRRTPASPQWPGKASGWRGTVTSPLWSRKEEARAIPVPPTWRTMGEVRIITVSEERDEGD